jgi:phage-related tail fiber protein
MSQTYYTILTKLGAELLANATALGVPLKLTSMAVGDGNGSIPKPIATQTTLVNEVRRAPLNSLSMDKNNPNQIIAEQVIPENEGGWFIHEIGLYDDKGNLIAIGNCPSSYKPRLAEGSGRTQVIRMIIIVDNVDSLALKIDPAVVLATREYVDSLVATKMAEHEKSTNHPNATIKSKGFVQLNSAIDSISETDAATPKAIKAAYDLANEKLSLLGGKLTGDLTIEKTNAGIILSTNDTNYTLSTSSAGDAFSFYLPDADNNNTQRLIYTKQDKTFNFKACEVKINNNDIVTSDRFESSLSESGYQKLPCGLIIQWGYQKSSFSNRQQKVTFPVTFPHTAFCVVCNNFGPINLYDDTADVGCYSKTTTSFQAYNYSDRNPAGFCWIAFGS